MIVEAFGVLAVVAMVTMYALEHRSPGYVLAFAVFLRRRLALRSAHPIVAFRGSRGCVGRDRSSPLVPQTT